MEAYLAARLGDSIGAHASGWDAFLKVLGAVAAGVAVVVVAVLLFGNPVGWAATAALVALGLGTTAGTAKIIKWASHRDTKQKKTQGLHPHLRGTSCSSVSGHCSTNVFIETKEAARAAWDYGNHGHSVIRQGSKTVFVNGTPLARENDEVKCGGRVLHGCERTWVGGAPSMEDQRTTADKWMDGLALWCGIGAMIASGVSIIAGIAGAATVVAGAIRAVVGIGGFGLSFKFHPILHKKIADATNEGVADAVDLGILWIGSSLALRAPKPTTTLPARNVEPGLDEFVFRDGNVRVAGEAKMQDNVLNINVKTAEGNPTPEFQQNFARDAVGAAQKMGASKVRVMAPNGKVVELDVPPAEGTPGAPGALVRSNGAPQGGEPGTPGTPPGGQGQIIAPLGQGQIAGPAPQGQIAGPAPQGQIAGPPAPKGLLPAPQPQQSTPTTPVLEPEAAPPPRPALPPQAGRILNGLDPNDKVTLYARKANGDLDYHSNIPVSQANQIAGQSDVTNVRLWNAPSKSDADWNPDSYVDGQRSVQKYFDDSPDNVRDLKVTYASDLDGRAIVNRDGAVALLNDPNVAKVSFDDTYETENLPDVEAIPPEQRTLAYRNVVMAQRKAAREAAEAKQQAEEQQYRDDYTGPTVPNKEPPTGLLDTNVEYPSVDQQMNSGDGTVTLYRGMRVPKGHALFDDGGVHSKGSFGGQYSTVDPRQALSYGANPEGDHPGGFQEDDDAVLVEYKARRGDIDPTSDPRVAVLRPGVALSQQPGFREIARVPAKDVFKYIPKERPPAPAPKLNPPKPKPTPVDQNCLTCVEKGGGGQATGQNAVTTTSTALNPVVSTPQTPASPESPLLTSVPDAVKNGGAFADGAKNVVPGQKNFGHAFTTHGAGSAIEATLRGRGRATGQPQGQWLDNQQAANYLAAEVKRLGRLDGPTVIDIPPGMGQILMPDGSVQPATKALLLPKGDEGRLKTAYPIPYDPPAPVSAPVPAAPNPDAPKMPLTPYDEADVRARLAKANSSEDFAALKAEMAGRQAPVTPELIANGAQQLSDMSPTFKGTYDKAVAQGWRVEPVAQGQGTLTDGMSKVVTIEAPLVRYGDGGNALAHEFGHVDAAMSEPPPEQIITDNLLGPDANPVPKDQFVDAMVNYHMRDEGKAVMFNGQVRDEVLASGGPDIRGVDPAEQAILDQYKAGTISKDQALDGLGKIRETKIPSDTPNKTYAQKTRDYYSELYDDIVPKGPKP